MNTIRDDADWITRRWSDLLEARYHGTPRPWRQTHKRRVSEERTGPRPPFTLTAAPAPVDLDATDLIRHILTRTAQLAYQVATELQHQHILTEMQRRRPTHPAKVLDYLAVRHPQTSIPTQQHLEQQLRIIRGRMTEQFAERFDGQIIRADCPWCRRPGLRVRLIGPAHKPEPVVICEHDGCNPPTSECGKWWRGHPAWPFHEWEWLDRRIGA